MATALRVVLLMVIRLFVRRAEHGKNSFFFWECGRPAKVFELMLSRQFHYYSSEDSAQSGNMGCL